MPKDIRAPTTPQSRKKYAKGSNVEAGTTGERSQANDHGCCVEAVVKRVSRGLIACDLRIASTSGLAPSSECYSRFYEAEGVGKTSFDKHEKLAANYYESRGWTVLRLGHFALQGVGHLEDLFPESKILGDLMREHLPNDIYERITVYARGHHEAIALNGVDPRFYPVVFYPPDFLLVDKKERFRFAEVKGPTDRLGLRQANWFVHSLPAAWEFEILALVSEHLPGGEMFVAAQGQREGPAFEAEFGDWLDKVEEFNRRGRSIRKRSRRPDDE